MSACEVYLRGGFVYVPTLALTEAGFHFVIGPVAVVPVLDTLGVAQAIEACLRRGHPRMPTPSPESFERSALLDAAQVASWAAFGRGARHWEVEEEGGRFKIMSLRQDRSGGWEEDEAAAEWLPEGSSFADASLRMAQVLVT